MKAIKTVKTTTLFKQYKYVVLRSPILEERNISILDGLIRLETKQNSSALNSIIREKQPLTSSPIDLFASLDSTEKCSQTFSKQLRFPRAKISHSFYRGCSNGGGRSYKAEQLYVAFTWRNFGPCNAQELREGSRRN